MLNVEAVTTSQPLYDKTASIQWKGIENASRGCIDI
jgi:hypothetical protein